jgi:superoxide dismutase, Cu-Zn family
MLTRQAYVSLIATIVITFATSEVRAQTGPAAVAELRPSGAATTRPTANNVTGTIRFDPKPDGSVRVTGTITGLEPNGKHGIHIHETADMSAPDLTSTGGHFNPSGHQHGAPGSGTHAGDLGNLTADASGQATIDLTVSAISVGTGEANDVVGKPVIVHAQADDLTSQPSGNSGDRIAGGVIKQSAAR